MNNWQKWFVVVGGLVAIVGAFWTNTFYLSGIGGVLALIGGLVK